MDECREEQWLPIPGTDGWYQVSDQGRVRSYERLYMPGQRLREPRELLPRADAYGYQVVQIRQLHPKAPQKVHKLVMLAFVGKAPPGAVICHWDDDPSNNQLSNLRYGTKSENALDAARNGRRIGKLPNSHCKHGHPLSGDNLLLLPRTNGRALNRNCRTCYTARRKRDQIARQAKLRDQKRNSTTIADPHLG